MGIDPILLKNAADTPRFSLLRNRQATSDHVEAKANIMATRILDHNPVQELRETIEELPEESAEAEGTDSTPARRFVKPDEADSGLIDPSIVPDESQIAAINMLLDKQYGCLIGAAGSGKTTTLRRFLHYVIYGSEELGVDPLDIRALDGKQSLSIALCAFTGIATQVIKQNMPSWLHPACKTIHSLLEYMPVGVMVAQEDGSMKEKQVFMPTRDATNKFQYDVIVIDEASMVGIELWHQILDACNEGTKIFLIGDLNQLPPVMSQSMFAYALASWPVAELTKIHRQKEAAANKIIEAAHAILNGEDSKLLGALDNPGTNHNWRVIGFEVHPDATKAGAQIVTIANELRKKRVHSSVDPETPLIYDPYRDRVITTGNGYDENNSSASIQQSAINEALARLIEPPSEENPFYIIDAGMSRKKFARGHRVMATKNESPDIVDRVTNGMVGVIVEINRNAGWDGNPHMVGPETQVMAHRNASLDALFGKKSEDDDEPLDIEGLDTFSFSMESKAQSQGKEGGGPASHAVTVKFANNAVRTFTSKSQVDSLQLAYASTCHKCQGSQFDTAIIVVHHAGKAMLSREWLYTAVTRAQKRVVLLYTKHGVKLAVARQKIFGRTLAEKIRKYQELQTDTVGMYKGRVRLYIEE